MTEERYSHTDLYACAFMVANNINILSVEALNEYSSKFIMDCDVEAGRALYKKYKANEKVGVLDLKYSLKRAKDILFNKEENE